MPELNPFGEFIERYRNNPVLFVEEVLDPSAPNPHGIILHGPDIHQKKVLQAVADGQRRITIRSGHGVGKTAVLSWIIIWHALTREPQKALVTAPTSAQLFDALAAEVKFWITKLPVPLQKVFDVKSESITHTASPSSSFISFATSRADTPEALAGKHSENMLLIADEASGVPEQVFEAAIGSMSGHDAIMILAGNPIRSSGYFYNTFNKPEMKGDWYPIHISCENHPRVSQDFVQQVARTYGEKSNAYRVRVLGEFPLADDNTIIPFELVEAAKTRDVAATNVIPIWGLDCARFGSDRSALAKRQGNVLIEPVKSWHGLSAIELAQAIKIEYDSTNLAGRPSVICVDSIGLGAGVADILRNIGLPALDINVGESSSMKEKFRNLKAELWWAVRDWFYQRNVSLTDSKLAEELIAPQYKYTQTNKIQVESKDEMKKRGVLEGKSPDLADAFILTFAVEAMQVGSNKFGAQSWSKPLKHNMEIV
jgi:phage terminase large subunit